MKIAWMCMKECSSVWILDHALTLAETVRTSCTESSNSQNGLKGSVQWMVDQVSKDFIFCVDYWYVCKIYQFSFQLKQTTNKQTNKT